MQNVDYWNYENDGLAPLEIFKKYLPDNLRAGDENCYTNIRNKKTAIKYKYIAPNHICNKKFMCFDIDINKRDDIEYFDPSLISNELQLPPPNLIITSPDTGNHHIVFFLNNPVHHNPNSSAKALMYFKSVYKAMALALEPLGADVSFRNNIIQNPLCKYWEVIEYSYTEYELRDFAKHLTFVARDYELSMENEFEPVEGQRSHWLFKELQILAIANRKSYYPHRLVEWDSFIQNHAQQLDDLIVERNDWSWTFAQHTAKSVGNYIWQHGYTPINKGRDKSLNSFNLDLSQKQALSAHKTNEQQRKKTKDRIVFGFEEAEKQKLKPTQKTIAKLSGINTRTIRRYKDFFQEIKKSGHTVYIR